MFKLSIIMGLGWVLAISISTASASESTIPEATESKRVAPSLERGEQNDGFEERLKGLILGLARVRDYQERTSSFQSTGHLYTELKKQGKANSVLGRSLLGIMASLITVDDMGELVDDVRVVGDVVALLRGKSAELGANVNGTTHGKEEMEEAPRNFLAIEALEKIYLEVCNNEKKAIAGLLQLARSDNKAAQSYWLTYRLWYVHTSISEEDTGFITAILPWLKVQAVLGQVYAQRNLGTILLFGVEGNNDEDAIYWLKKAAAKKDGWALVVLGWCYKNGWGKKIKPKRAVDYFEKASVYVPSEAAYALGVCYAEGSGVKKNHKHAAALFEKAAQLGHIMANSRLGVCHYKGKGVRRNYSRAIEHFTLAADAGDSNSTFNLGVCFAKGKGTKKAPDRAIGFYRLAAKDGHEKAKAALEDLQRRSK